VIGWLRGELLARGADSELLVDVNGVGYRVLVPATVISSVGELGQTVALFVHTHVREDAIVLYGFASASERQCFEALLGAHGVGPSLALAIMSSLQPAALIRAVIDGDLDVLCSVPGVGRKTAARLVIDLKSKLDLPGDDTVGRQSGAPASERSEVRGALQELGYGPDEIRRALDSIPETGSVEDLLRGALRELAGVGNRR
jgi:Holliday junction DNA helicase RuvA